MGQNMHQKLDQQVIVLYYNMHVLPFPFFDFSMVRQMVAAF